MPSRQPIPVELAEEVVQYLDPTVVGEFQAIRALADLSKQRERLGDEAMEEEEDEWEDEEYMSGDEEAVDEVIEALEEQTAEDEAELEAAGAELAAAPKGEEEDDAAPRAFRSGYLEGSAARALGKAFDGTDSKWGEAVDPAFLRFIRTIEANPHLAPLVKTVAYYGDYHGDAPAQAIEHVLDLCPNVDDVRLVHKAKNSGGGYSSWLMPREEAQRELPVMAVLQRKVPNLRRLVVRGVHHTASAAFGDSLPPFSSLKHLAFTFDMGERSDEEPEFFVSRPSFQLESIATNAIFSPSSILCLIEPSATTLTSLSIALDREKLDLSACKALTSLAVEFARPTTVLKSLKTLKSSKLRSLELRRSGRIQMSQANYDRWNIDDGPKYADGSDDERERAAAQEARLKKEGKKDAYGVFLPALPATLEYLYLGYYLDLRETGPFVRALADPAALPSLRVLDVADEALFKPEHMFEEELDDFAVELAQTFRKEVAAACEKRGWALGSRTEHWQDGPGQKDEQMPRTLSSII
ncbi:hypothetical protein JCM8097_004765 [Rhodosporidiobolus ruineniae]